MVDVTDAKEPAFSLPPSGRHPLYSTFRPRSQTLLHAGVWAAYFAALCAAACRLERERVWIRGAEAAYLCGSRPRKNLFLHSLHEKGISG